MCIAKINRRPYKAFKNKDIYTCACVALRCLEYSEKPTTTKKPEMCIDSFNYLMRKQSNLRVKKQSPAVCAAQL